MQNNIIKILNDKDIIIIKEDIDNILYFSKIKGIERFLEVASYYKNLGVEYIDSTMLLDTTRYDTRLRRLIFKYLIMFEEYLRAQILNGLMDEDITSREKLLKLINNIYKDDKRLNLKLKRITDKKLTSLYECINETTFAELIDFIEKYEEFYLKFFNIEHKEFIIKHKKDIILLRNLIAHNKILQIQEYGTNKNLEEVLKIFGNSILDNYRNGLEKEVNRCHVNKNNILKLNYYISI